MVQKAKTREIKEKKIKRRERKNIPTGIVCINATFNNTLITITDLQGNTIAGSSAGAKGFKGSRKSTPYAAQMATEEAVTKVIEHGMKSVMVFIKGPGSGRESALRALHAKGMNVTEIHDITSTPHNGCKPRKRRRV